MSILSWNCYGLDNPQNIQFLKDLIIQKRPNFIFLCETICKKDVVEKVRMEIGFEGMVVFDAHGHSGGVALLWRYKEEVSLFSLGKNHINVGIKCENMAEYCRRRNRA